MVVTFYFFALTQKSNKKRSIPPLAGEKMTKNYFVNLNPANSPPHILKLMILLAQIPLFAGPASKRFTA